MNRDNRGSLAGIPFFRACPGRGGTAAAMPFCKEMWRIRLPWGLFVQVTGCQRVARKCRLAVQNGLFGRPKRRVSQSETARFVTLFHSGRLFGHTWQVAVNVFHVIGLRINMDGNFPRRCGILAACRPPEARNMETLHARGSGWMPQIICLCGKEAAPPVSPHCRKSFFLLYRKVDKNRYLCSKMPNRIGD